MQAHAKRLIDLGFNVFPLAPFSKNPPLVTDFTGQSRNCAEMYMRWWAEHSENNIGLSCEGLLVLDIDVRKGGMETFKKLRAQLQLPSTMTFRTASGGFHVLYDCPEETRNSVQKLGAGLDVRAIGGYIVAPGSRTEKGSYTILAAISVVPAPDALIQLCASTVKASTQLQDQISPVDQTRAITLVKTYLAKAPPATEGAGGDDSTYRILCKVRDYGVLPENALEAVYDWNQRCIPPWSIEELRSKIHNAYAYARNSYAVDSTEALFPDEDAPKKGGAYSFADIDLKQILRLDYLVKHWITKGTHNMLFGPWGAGKTFIALDLASRIASGEECFGSRVCAGGVLYLSYEGNISMQKRMAAIKARHPERKLELFLMLPMRHALVSKALPDRRAYGWAQAKQALEYFVYRHKQNPLLVIVDTLRNALGGSDSDPDLTTPYFGFLQEMTALSGSGTLTVHHPGHSDKTRSRGDSGLEAAMDTIIRIDPETKLIGTIKQRDGAARKIYYDLIPVSLGNDPEGEDCTSCVVEYADGNPASMALSYTHRQVYDALTTQFEPEESFTKTRYYLAAGQLSKSAKDAALGALLDKGYVVVNGTAYQLGGDIF